GIPSINFGFSSGNGIYHSRYDSHWFFTKFGDPGFAYGKKLSELVAIFLLRMANAEVLPFDYTRTAETIDRYLDELEKAASASGLEHEIDLLPVRDANASLKATGLVLQRQLTALLNRKLPLQRRQAKLLRRVNEALLKTEQAFLYAKGLPGRPWYKHQIYAPGFYTGYGVKTLPGVREAIEKKDAREARDMIRVLQSTLNRAQQQLLRAAVLIAAESNS
ncbi:MAG: glutamate carboxypeptidase, partial [Calditrichaeota bacterium]